MIVFGCGGGGGSNGPGDQLTALRSSTVVLEDHGITVGDVQEGFIVVEGDVSAISVGSVLISFSGNGLLRRVLAVEPLGGGQTRLTTETAGIMDAFESFHLSLTGTRGSELEFSPIVVPLPDLTIADSIDFDADVTNNSRMTAIRMTWPVHEEQYSMHVDSMLTVTMTTSNSASFEETVAQVEIPLGRFIVPAPPFVIPFIAKANAKVIVKGAVTAGTQTSYSVRVFGPIGIRYTESDGWSGFEQLAVEHMGGFGAAEGAVEVEFGPEIEISLRAFGVYGPYWKARPLSVVAEGQVQTDPAGIRVYLGMLESNTFGINGKVSDDEFADFSYTISEPRINWFEDFFPTPGTTGGTTGGTSSTTGGSTTSGSTSGGSTSGGTTGGSTVKVWVHCSAGEISFDGGPYVSGGFVMLTSGQSHAYLWRNGRPSVEWVNHSMSLHSPDDESSDEIYQRYWHYNDGDGPLGGTFAVP
jgi:hypothetical protein